MESRVWAEIDLATVRHNVNAIRAHVGLRVDVMPVVKADGYGHGAAEVARAALEAGAEWLGVATVAEGVDLRALFPAAKICVFAPFQREECPEIVLNRLIPFLSDLEQARALSQTAQRLRAGAQVHLEVDTGMGRSGVLPEQAAQLANWIARMPAILITGLSTHFPSADEDPHFTLQQLRIFHQVRAAVEATDTRLSPVHCANSAALLRYPASRLDLVRPGLLTYGILPPVPPDTPIPPVRPALTLKTRIALVRKLPQGHTISYGRTYALPHPGRIATLPVGYGDGYPRALSNVGHVLVCGRKVPIVGRICMDVTMIDISNVPEAHAGAEVVLVGKQDEQEIRVEEIARLTQTTAHDVTTRLTARVPRIYHSN
jgi:alanine racemase